MLFSLFLFVLVISTLPHEGAADCLVGDIRNETEIMKTPDGAVCVLVIRMSDNCEQTTIRGEMVHTGSDQQGTCEETIDKANRSVFRCICSSSCNALVNAHEFLSDSKCGRIAKEFLLSALPRDLSENGEHAAELLQFTLYGLLILICAALTGVSFYKYLTLQWEASGVEGYETKSNKELIGLFFLIVGWSSFAVSCFPFALAVFCEAVGNTFAAAVLNRVAFRFLAVHFSIAFVNSFDPKNSERFSATPGYVPNILCSFFLLVAAFSGFESGFESIWGYVTNFCGTFAASINIISIYIVLIKQLARVIKRQ